MLKIELSKPAEKSIEKIYKSDRNLYRRFINAFQDIAKDPSQGKLLHGKLKGLSSYRMGSYRIIYETYHNKLLVIILDLGHRKEIYK
ncbi:MAG: type II toxin-antitoxin system RelE/ParE family toxin [Candidatus Omnitrophica bacterium]|nr:type II toxin-antitoxin system RelE/ParE family toxin [Candidatus Omnitrophota bacterium]MCG2702806.1 type II toxin-antitoxin system RelE/ParE family toxin [Candidatus Omnitrophota bacterium]